MVSRTVEVGQPTQRPDEPFVFVVTYLPLRSYWTISAFIRLSGKIESQLRASPGAIRYSVRTDIPGKRFWTLSVWSSGDDMALFSRSEPHRTAMKRFYRWGTDSAAIAEWESDESTIDWTEAEKRLKTPLFRYAYDGKRLVHAAGSKSVPQG